MPPMHEIAHLAHVELRTLVPVQSLEFFHAHDTPPVAEAPAAEAP